MERWRNFTVALSRRFILDSERQDGFFFFFLREETCLFFFSILFLEKTHFRLVKKCSGIYNHWNCCRKSKQSVLQSFSVFFVFSFGKHLFGVRAHSKSFASYFYRCELLALRYVTRNEYLDYRQFFYSFQHWQQLAQFYSYRFQGHFGDKGKNIDTVLLTFVFGLQWFYRSGAKFSLLR